MAKSKIAGVHRRRIRNTNKPIISQFRLEHLHDGLRRAIELDRMFSAHLKAARERYARPKRHWWSW